MRRLIVWTAALMGIISLIIVSLRGSNNTACVRIDDQITGNALTIDLNARQARLDARTALPIPTSDASRDAMSLSPDQHYVMYNISEQAGEYDSPLSDLAFGVRSTGARKLHRLSAINPILEYSWSPTSKHIAFTEFRAWTGQGDVAVANLIVMDTSGRLIKRELIPDFSDDNWADHQHPFNWSPDGSVFTLSAFRDGVGATLIVQPINATRAKYLTFPDERILNVEWSPTKLVAVVITGRDPGYLPLSDHKVYFIGADGSVIKVNALNPDYEPQFDNDPAQQHWSPDGQYIQLTGQVYLDVFSAHGDRVTPTLSRTLTSFWSTLPHTLLYQLEQNGHQSFLVLGAATGQSTPLVASIAPQHPNQLSWWFSPDESEIVVAEQGNHGKAVLHVIPRNLSINATPFGEIQLSELFYPAWSPDKRKLSIVDERPTEFVIKTWLRDSGAVQQYHVVKRMLPNEQLGLEWLTDDLMLITGHQQFSLGKTLTLLNTRTMNFITPISGLDVQASNDDYITLRTSTGFSFYATQTGQLLLSLPLPTDYGGYEVYPAPNLQAALFNSQPVLYLSTLRGSIKIADEIWTPPTWSPDGSKFMYAKWSSDGWTLNVLSQDGTPLTSFFHPHNKYDPDWSYLRWTNCD